MSEETCFPKGVFFVDGRARLEDVELANVARTYGTPLYVYSKKTITSNIEDWAKEVQNTPHRVFYAMKANSTRAILQLFLRAGFGIDIVSGGELARALAAGAHGSDIVYSGVGKTVDEIKAALAADVLCFNVESESEIFRISNLAGELNKTAKISFRVNPDVDPKTHPYISTGLKNNKFGIAYDQAVRLYKLAKSLPNIEISGIDCHIGSQITELQPFLDAAKKIADVVKSLKSAGIDLKHIDFGGGLGISYNGETSPKASQLVCALKNLMLEEGLHDIALYFEPGRHLIANAGILLTEVQYLKPTENKNFCIVDASMSDMIRPALYEAKMPLFNCYDRQGAVLNWDIVGPVCESADWLAKDIALVVRPGDILAQSNTGAYGTTMGSNYNSRPLCAEVLLDQGKIHIIRKRQSVQEMMQNEADLA